MSRLGQRAVELALQSVGVREETPNWGKWVSVYLKFVGIFFPAPWCMAFVTYKIHQAAQELKIATDLPKSGPTASSCTALYQWAKKNGRLLALPEKGCIFLVKGDGKYVHTGLVTGVVSGIIHTIEGNTNDDGSANGNGVYTRIRTIESCVYVRV